MLSRLLVVGHQQQHGCSRRLTVSVVSGPSNPARWLLKEGFKCVLVKCIGVSASTSPAPDVVLVDAGQLLHHLQGWMKCGEFDSWAHKSVQGMNAGRSFVTLVTETVVAHFTLQFWQLKKLIIF